MKSIFDKLNLRPGERRLVVGVGIVIFIVLNVWFIFPNFGQAGILEQKITDTGKNLKKFQDEVKKKPEYERELKKLETMGQYVGTDANALELQKEVDAQATLANVNIFRRAPVASGSSRTNAFFDEAGLVITVSTTEKELIDFLYNLGSSKNSLIRVRDMTLGPELPARQKLQGNITLVESFQRKPTKVAAAAPAAKPAAPAPKPSPKPPPVKTNAPAATKPTVAPKPPSTTKPTTTGKTNQTKKPLLGK